jgi:hypothetical protein
MNNWVRWPIRGPSVRTFCTRAHSGLNVKHLTPVRGVVPELPIRMEEELNMVREQHHQATATATATLERRTEPRIKAGLSALVRTPNSRPMEGCLLDVSPKGARVRVPNLVPVGTIMRIEAHELVLVGNIQRCDQTHGAYEAGVELSVPMEMLDELRLLNAALCAESECV